MRQITLIEPQFYDPGSQIGAILIISFVFGSSQIATKHVPVLKQQKN